MKGVSRVCPKCRGYMVLSEEDIAWRCLNCGILLYNYNPIPKVSPPPGGRNNHGGHYNRIKF